MRKSSMNVLFFVALTFGCNVEPEIIQSQSESQMQPQSEKAHLDFVVDGSGWETVKGSEMLSEPLPVAQTPIPPGFPETDQYKTHSEACEGVILKEVPKEKKSWQRAILLWCEHRNYHASRYTIVKSQVDGSQIHDRDRPTAWMFYTQNVLSGVLTPDNCEFHEINRKLKHTKNCRKLMKDWPFKNKLSEKRRRQWYSHPHDMEKFGARGPHDWNANAYKYIPGCWDPKQLDRFDVSITATVRHSLEICQKHGCLNKKDIKKYW